MLYDNNGIYLTIKNVNILLTLTLRHSVHYKKTRKEDVYADRK